MQERRGLDTQYRGFDTQCTQHTGEAGSLHTTYRGGGVFTHNIQGRRGLDTQRLGPVG